MRTTFETPAILFDFDGVVADTAAANRRHWHELCADLGLDTDDVLKRATGRRTDEFMAELAQEHPFDVKAKFKWFEELSANDIEGIEEVPGASKLLNALPKGTWGIVTVGNADTTKKILKHLDLPIPEVLVTSKDVKVGKPDPACYTLGVKRLKLKPAQVVVIEDTPAGIRSASAAKTKVVAVTTTHSRAQLPLSMVNALGRDLNDVYLLDATKSLVTIEVVTPLDRSSDI